MLRDAVRGRRALPASRRFHLRSPVLALAALSSIGAAFALAYWMYVRLLGIERMLILNFLSVFILLGVGADDVCILADAFRVVSLERPALPCAARVQLTLERAGWAMFVTSLTSACSFFANLVSALPALRSFGVFMGAVIVANFVTVVVAFPPALVSVDARRHRQRLRATTPDTAGGPDGPDAARPPCRASMVRRRARRRSAAAARRRARAAALGARERTAEAQDGGALVISAAALNQPALGAAAAPPLPEPAMDAPRVLRRDAGWSALDIALHDVWVPFVSRRFGVLLAALGGVALIALIGGSVEMRPSSDTPQFFPRSMNLGLVYDVHDRYIGEELEASGTGAASDLECPVAWNADGTVLGVLGPRRCLNGGSCLCETGFGGSGCSVELEVTIVPTDAPIPAPTPEPTPAPTTAAPPRARSRRRRLALARANVAADERADRAARAHADGHADDRAARARADAAAHAHADAERPRPGRRRRPRPRRRACRHRRPRSCRRRSRRPRRARRGAKR